MSKTTTISTRLSEEKKQEFDEILEEIGLTRQDVMESWIDLIVENKPSIVNSIKPVKRQFLEAALKEMDDIESSSSTPSEEEQQ